jgi:hypothetical protein
MNSEILNQMIGGIRLVQGLTGETVTIADVDYPCTVADMSTVTEAEYVQGGRIKKYKATLSVLQTDLPTAPDVNTLVTFRGIAYRVDTALDATTFWNLSIDQAGA